MWIKDDVRLDNLSPQIVLATMIVKDCYAELHQDTTITSGSEGAHARLTFHRNGDAFDFRTVHLSNDTRLHLAAMIRARLGPNFDVRLENAPPHLHVHFNSAPTPPLAPT